MTPVLIITFNRPDYLNQLLAALKKAKVEILYVFRDGPRPNNEGDNEKCHQIENLVKNIDWECEVKTNFMQNNLGCGYGPYSAISWAFQYTDKLIILEDDCIPSTAFFPYCDYLLEKFKNDTRVRHISGYSPFAQHPSFRNTDYLFTQYAHTWGWATWKRVWDGMDMQERLIHDFFLKGGFKGQFSSKEEDKFFNNYYWSRPSPLLEATHSWDYQYAVHSKMNGALSIVPAKNLIHNIGAVGTHSVSASLHNLLQSDSEYHIVNEPAEIAMDKVYEAFCFDAQRNYTFGTHIRRVLYRLKNKVFGRPDYQ